MTEISDQSINKTIWIMWWQGFDNAPDIVKMCLESWRSHNKEWNIVELDMHNFYKYVDISDLLEKNSSPTLQVKANVIRLKLLAKYGGLWIDSTCYCCKPLDSWICDYIQSGFFAFRNPHRLRKMSNWFIFADRNSYLIQELTNRYCKYFESNEISLSGVNKYLTYFSGKVLNLNSYTTQFWMSWFVRRILKAYPYFCFHYIFSDLLRCDPVFNKYWKAVKAYPADDPHKLQCIGLLEPISRELMSEIDQCNTPVYKLDWKKAKGGYAENSVLGYLFKKYW